MTMNGARPITLEELRSMAEECEHSTVRELLGDMAEDGVEDYDGNFLTIDGDCVVVGDLDTDEHEIAVLVVRGSLTVGGYFRDHSDDGPTVTVVLGDLRAKNVVTAGLLEVKGSMVVREAVVGDYNDGGVLIHGGLQADLFMPMEIGYAIRGEVTAREQLPFATTRLDSVPQRLHPRFFVATEGKAELFAGEVGDAYVAAIANGESILAP